MGADDAQPVRPSSGPSLRAATRPVTRVNRSQLDSAPCGSSPVFGRSGSGRRNSADTRCLTRWHPVFRRRPALSRLRWSVAVRCVIPGRPRVTGDGETPRYQSFLSGCEIVFVYERHHHRGGGGLDLGRLGYSHRFSAVVIIVITSRNTPTSSHTRMPKLLLSRYTPDVTDNSSDVRCDL